MGLEKQQTKTQHSIPINPPQVTDILDNNGLIQLYIYIYKNRPGINTLDIIETNHPSSFRTEIVPEVSDHDIVYTVIDIVPTRQQQKPRQIPIYSKAK